MGYRSQVRIATTQDGWKFMQSRYAIHLKECIAKGLDGFNLLECMDSFQNDKDENVYFGWDDIKWYENVFGEIVSWYETFKDLEKENIPFQFLRLGEDPTDIEEIYHLEHTDLYSFFVESRIVGLA